MLDIGSIIDGKYKILNVIGKGGMSVVYQAVNERANKQWAIKEIRKDGMQNYEVVRQNLIAETDMLKKLSHPNLPSIIDVIDRDGTFLIVMDYIEGRPLSDVLKASGAQPQEDVIEWAKQLCDVLGYLHSRKPSIIYRDMKPSNVMLKPDGNVALIDFGTAREFKSTSVEDTSCLGTRGYAAPEQYGGHGQTDARTDIYCLGATMYHLVTGHNPAMPPYEMYPIREWNPLLSSGLEDIILKCTQANPNQRYQNCAELLYALDNVAYLEVDSKRIMNTKWRLFITSAVITVVMGLAAVGFNIGTSSQKANTYQSLVESAKREVAVAGDTTKTNESKEKRIEYCKKAIQLDPYRTDAYKALIQTYYYNGEGSFDYQDTKLTYDEEFRQFREITAQYLDTDSELVKTEKLADDVYLEIGEGLFLLCDNKTEAKNVAITWLEKAIESCSQDNKERAELLLKVCNNYAQTNRFAQINAKGELQEINYGEYWHGLLDLQRLAIIDMDKKNNVLIPIMTTELCVGQIQNNITRFQKGGVEKAEFDQFINTLSQDLEKIKEKLQGAEENVYSADRRQNINDIGHNIENAKDDINKAFGESTVRTEVTYEPDGAGEG